MRIAWLLDDTTISGATRVQLAQADALVARGHQVRLVTPGLPLTWRSSRAEWVYVDELRAYDASEDEVVIAATDEAFAIARLLAEGRARRIEPSFGPVIDEEVFRDRVPPDNEPLRVLLYGASQSERKGISDGYGAAAHARWFHQQFDLVRVSPYAPSREEPLDAVQEFHVALAAREMTRLMHSCDLLIAPSRRDEEVGLTAAEALAAGLAVVMTSIPPFLALDTQTDFALFAPEDKAVELGERLIEVLENDELRAHLRKRGREAAEKWRAGRAGERVEAWLRR